MLFARVIPVANAAAATAYRGRLGDILVTLDTGAIYLAGSGSAQPTPAGLSSGAAPVAAGVLTSAASATLSNSNNTLTANAPASLATALGVLSVAVGALVLIVAGTAADGLWTVTNAGSGAVAWVLDRPTSYRTFAGLPGVIVVASDLAGNQTVYALGGVTPTPTPGTTAIPYYRVDQVAAALASSVKGSQAAALASISSGSAIPQVFKVDVTSATNDTPVVLPYACELINVTGVLSVAAAGSAILRSAAGGGGTAYATLSTAAMGGAIEGVTSPLVTPRALPAATYYLNRSDTAVRGTFYLTCLRT